MIEEDTHSFNHLGDKPDNAKLGQNNEEPTMLEPLSVLCLIAAFAVLVALVIVDLRTLLLPNVLVLALALLGAGFHACTLFYYNSAFDLAVGAVIGGGLLFLIRAAGNAYYKTETLGLGDVKLMAAGGLWLGSDFILPAIIAGALAGLIHGGVLITAHRIKTKEAAGLSRFSLPAGPGFACGLLIAALAKFSGLPHLHF